MAFLKKWEVRVRVEQTPEASEAVWAGTGPWIPAGGMTAPAPLTLAVSSA